MEAPEGLSSNTMVHGQIPMADLGNIGLTFLRPKQGLHPYSFCQNKAPTNVIIHIDDALPYAGGLERHPIYFFTEYGSRVDTTFVDTTGNAYSYDWDDGNYYAVQVGTGNLWSIVVAGTTVTITHPFTNDRAYAHAFA